MSNWPKIPSYSDSENNVFHPVFAHALNLVLKERKLDSDVTVQSQFQTPTGPADFVLLRKSTGKVIIPIEIKRTQSGVRGLGRRQARDYQQNLATIAETTFYCVSNLELTELFCNAKGHETTLSQKIKLSTPQNALLEKGQDDLLKKNLITVINEIFDIIFFNNPFSYVAGLSNFEYLLRNTIDGVKYWHESLLPFCFEYIRGSSQLTVKTRSWRSAYAYKKNPQRLVELGKQIDFQNIFAYPLAREEHFDMHILQDAYNSGQCFGDGDDFSALVGDILFEPQSGIVETDFDLARLLAIIATNTADALTTDDVIMDPCAGSGRLLAAMIKESRQTILPTNVIAVEKEKKFAEALSLRLGLQFGANISPSNSPIVKIENFEDTAVSDYSKVKIAVVNPPFMSGVQSASLKGDLLSCIQKVSGKKSIVGNGQIGYEAIFMELLWHMLPQGVTIAFIFPYQIISRLSDEMASFRKFLLEKLAISTVVLYPQDGVFDSVVKKTMIFVGQKGTKTPNIRVIDIQIPVPDVDFLNLKEFLQKNTSCYGVEEFFVPRVDLLNAANSGWKTFLGNGKKTAEFINNPILCHTIKDYSNDVRRGSMGNSGNTALTVMLAGKPHSYIPRSWLISAINNAKTLPAILDNSSAPNCSFVPPSSTRVKSNKILLSIAQTYVKNANGQFSTKKQKTNDKTEDDIVSAILKDQKQPATNAILIPRSYRENAKLSIIMNDPILVSTNFFIVPIDDYDTRILVASWLKSIFGQLQLEFFATNQESMRKVEKNVITKVRIPDLTSINKRILNLLTRLYFKESFHNLSSIKPKRSDLLWAYALWGKSYKTKTNEIVEFLQEAYDMRTQ
ncbi:MAG: hypothetical protein E7053_08950 [Lentisphaerae bacterium]|nr:hypothetical protein [Lentisphaerota bacterium]